MSKELKDVSLQDIDQVVDTLLEIGKGISIWTFEGNLGSGKTTLIKLLAQRFGIKDEVSSPTFNYVNDYDGKVYHFDCYRLKNVEEALGFGFEEYLDSGKPCWIEWPEVISPLFQDPYLEIKIEHNTNGTRTYTLTIN